MSKFSSGLVIALVSLVSFGFKHAADIKTKVNWQTTDEVTTQYTAEKKPIIVDIYTDWCHYCKVMDKTTYSNDSVANYINKHFYRAKLNAESKTAFNWMGKSYNYIPKFKLNELVINLTKGNIVYPSTVIIPPNGEPQSVGGALSVKELELLIKYFGEDKFGKVSWEDYLKTFKSTW